MQVKEYAKVFKDIIFNSKGNKDDVFTGGTALKAILGNKLTKFVSSPLGSLGIGLTSIFADRKSVV